jgi:hypothetical protein
VQVRNHLGKFGSAILDRNSPALKGLMSLQEQFLGALSPKKIILKK